jgi:hypothetical protein
MTQLQKPVTRRTAVQVPHGIRPVLAVTLYPGGILSLREHGRRREYQVNLGTLYARLVREGTGKRGRI